MRIVLVSAQRNEGPYLLEWIAHHQQIGITDFLIYSNDCDDGSDILLDKLADAGVVTHVRHKKLPGKSIQWQALKAASKHLVYTGADWAIVADTDEFIALKQPVTSLSALIGKCDGADAIALSWRLFGNSGEAEFSDAPTISRFINAAPESLAYPALASHFKTLFRPTAFRECGVHRPKNKNNQTLPVWYDGAGRKLDPRFAAMGSRILLYGLKGDKSFAQLNHYSVRSAAEFLVKSGRGLPNRSDKKIDAAYWIERNFNSVPENTLASHVERVLTGMADLMKIDGLRDLHSAACAWHNSEFTRLMATEDGWRLYGRILLAGDSRVLEEGVARGLIERYQNVKKKDPR